MNATHQIRSLAEDAAKELDQLANVCAYGLARFAHVANWVRVAVKQDCPEDVDPEQTTRLTLASRRAVLNLEEKLGAIAKLARELADKPRRAPRTRPLAARSRRGLTAVR